MAKTFTITVPDDLGQALTAQAERLNTSPEETVVELSSQQLTTLQVNSVKQTETEPLLKLIGSVEVEISDLAENHDYYIGQSLYRELKGDE